MSEGNIAYTNKALNYYRIHGSNVTSTTKKQNHLDEIKKVHSIIRDRFGLNDTQEKNIENRYNYLKKMWNLEDK